MTTVQLRPQFEVFLKPEEVALQRIFQLLEDAGIRYCVLHGYSDFPRLSGSDVDCLIDQRVSQKEIIALFRRRKDFIGADLLYASGDYYLLGGTSCSGEAFFLHLDFPRDYSLGNVTIARGREVLALRQRLGGFYVSAPDVEFMCYLARCIFKDTLNEARITSLRRLYASDPEGCRKAVERILPGRALLIAEAIQSQNLKTLQELREELRQELVRTSIARYPAACFLGVWRRQIQRFHNVFARQGISAAFLGPDGAGKSSVVEQLPSAVGELFPRVLSLGFAPPLFRRLRKVGASTARPHALPARSPLVSSARVLYWFAYQQMHWLSLQFHLRRRTLALYDRHLLDILADPVRYRYGGPQWLLNALCMLSPKPDLIFVLDAPASVLQLRKQEVPLAETAQQLLRYRALAKKHSQARIVDVSKPLPRVVNEVASLIIQHLNTRR